jgi:3-deoxy-manno-octulosonate cytidylyltransferase (CMP-KDO synthetase)
MIQHVYERARQAHVDRVLVATDHQAIAAAVRGFGGEVVLTSPDHATGTDRLAEVARNLDAEIVVNVQGDEPLLNPRHVDAAVSPLLSDPELPMATVSVPFEDVAELLSPDVVKVVVNERGDALYFSRSVIPYVRLPGEGTSREIAAEALARGLARRHVGLYAYRRQTLLQLAALPPAPLEQAEALEQLRALHYGLRIRVVPAVDRPGPPSRCGCA